MDLVTGGPLYLHLRDLLEVQRRHRPDRTAIASVDGVAFTYAQIADQADAMRLALRGAGISPEDAVALVLPDGPLAALGFLTVASAAATAPLNPAYTRSEFESYFEQLSVRAVIVPAGESGAALDAAHARDVRILEVALPPEDAPGALWIGADAPPPAPARDTPPAGDAIALLLHTSGTTARPKVVPLTQANLCASARNIAEALALSESDRCLCVMPFFHVHGLVGGLLSTLTSGGCVICAPGFQSPRMLEWLDCARPTWYTAVPTMHQAVLERASQQRGGRVESSLRFIRSCSAALPPAMMVQLEDVFGVPVVEAYGMTEASHQIAVNPLPPAVRKAGSVGLPSGTEVAALGHGRVLEAGEVGEIAVRGPGVTAGYVNNPAANAATFTDGWFRTGDQGYRDADGYIFLTGRLKELINRAGEKISPREIDEVLLAHPAVRQAVAFGIPDSRLGEIVGAAVVLREPGATERELREFVADRLAFFKVPARIVFVDQLPKGPTGKLQRVGLADRLGIRAEEPRSSDRPSEVVEVIADRVSGIAAELLEVPSVDPRQGFFDGGGDSVLAARFLSRLRDAFDVDLRLLDVYDAPTLTALAGTLADRLVAQIASNAAAEDVVS